MSADFAFPEWWANAPEPPPPAPPPVDADRIEGLVNRFIAAKQDALHTAPDAFLRRSGGDAVDGAPGIIARLSQSRDTVLDQASDDHERAALGTRLEANLGVALDDIGRHVAEQRQVLNRQTIADRQALILQAAGLKHNDDALGGLAEAHAMAAGSLARLDGVPEEPAMQAARSAFWRSAIGQRLAAGEGAQALDLFEQAKGELVPADQRALEVPIQVARTDAAADAWIARETIKEGEPLVVRVQADATLSPAEKATTLAKIEARDSAKESARVATVRGLDDKLEATADSLATKPGTYKPGTLAALANAYEDAGESAKAGAIRRLAQQEGFLQSFARSGAAAQQRLIGSLPEGEDRAAAEAIQDRQAEAFAKDAFGAGTALYPDLGPPKPIDDMAGRIAQARTIAAYRDIPVMPFTADEIATMRRQLAEGTPQEREAVLRLVNALPDDMKPALDGPSPGEPRTYGIDAEASMKAAVELRGEGTDENAAATTTDARGAVHAPEPAPGSPEFEEADRQVGAADKPSWSDLTTLQQLGVAFQRLDEESKERGATLRADSSARHLQQVQEFQRRKDAGERLNVTEERYLLRNQRAAPDLGQAVGRLVAARRNLERLPASDALRHFLEAPTAPQAARLLRERPGEIAKALGVESLPGLTLSLITSAVLGPIAGGLALAGSSGLEGYANGLIGALADEDVDVTDPEDLAAALQDKDLMDRVRDKATTESAIQLGTTPRNAGRIL